MIEPPILTLDILFALAVLATAIFLFVTEKLRIDIVALLILIAIGVLGLLPPEKLFYGFSSNAVISMIAVMIIGAGLDNAGVMAKIAHFILKISGNTEKRVLPITLGAVSFVSSFMQNAATVALFLPVMSRIASSTQIPLSRLLMPTGFSALLGGTVTMVGCSALIMLNDLLINSNSFLPAGTEPMKPFSLFTPLPIGLALVITGITYFLLAGRWVFPNVKSEFVESMAPVNYFRRRHKLKGEIFELLVTPNSSLAGAMIFEFERHLEQKAAVIALLKGKNLRISPAKDVTLEAGDSFALLGDQATIKAFAQHFRLLLKPEIGIFIEVLVPTRSGISQIVIPSESQLIGYTLFNLRMRKTFGLTVLNVVRGGQLIRQGLRDLKLQAGDTLTVHSTWEDLTTLEANKNFIIVTQNFPRIYQIHESYKQDKLVPAIGFTLLAIGLVLFSNLPLALALLMGAAGMVVTNVISIDECYKRVSWQTVFLLAGLIPLGMAIETSGAATWMVHYILNTTGNLPSWVLQTILAILATMLTMVMSNVGTTVLLVPLAINIAIHIGADPAVFALTVTLATSNAFFLPTHQANALVIGPGKYRVRDYMRAGGMMTVLFLVVLISMINLIF